MSGAESKFFMPKPRRGILEPVTRHPPPRPKPTRLRGLANNRYIYIYAQVANNPSRFDDLKLLAGDQPPQVIDGYAQWQTVARPLWRALTVFQGYNPIVLRVPMRFVSLLDGSWLTDDDAGKRIEDEIGILEWMAGTGLESGAPPFVWLSTFDNNGSTTSLIPFWYQNSPTANVPQPLRNHYSRPWVITGLDWDPAPLRNANGYRTRQDVTMTVQLYEGGSQQPPSAAHRREKSLGGKALAFVTNRRAQTPLAIAGSANIAGDRMALAKAIVHFAGNEHLHLRSVYTKIAVGRRVLIPFNY